MVGFVPVESRNNFISDDYCLSATNSVWNCGETIGTGIGRTCNFLTQQRIIDVGGCGGTVGANTSVALGRCLASDGCCPD